jgi:hypothetical protein
VICGDLEESTEKRLYTKMISSLANKNLNSNGKRQAAGFSNCLGTMRWESKSQKSIYTSLHSVVLPCIDPLHSVIPHKKFTGQTSAKFSTGLAIPFRDYYLPTSVGRHTTRIFHYSISGDKGIARW